MNKKLDALEYEMKIVNREIENFRKDFFKVDDDSSREVLDELHRKMNILNELKKFLYDEIYYIKREIVASNEVLELSRYGMRHAYRIYLKNIPNLIGKIEYRYGNINCTGNIGYNIDLPYQGHGYAAIAFDLLNDILYKDGIKEVIVIAKVSNLASIKTIEKMDYEELESDDISLKKYKVYTKR